VLFRSRESPPGRAGRDLAQDANLASIPLHEPQNTTPDLQTLRNYLEGNEPADKTASNR